MSYFPNRYQIRDHTQRWYLYLDVTTHLEPFKFRSTSYSFGEAS
jgi:hypothetical protein